MSQEHTTEVSKRADRLGLRFPWMSCAVAAVLIALYLVEMRSSESPKSTTTPSLATLVSMGAVSGRMVAAGEYYRIITASLLHTDAAHVANNAVALVLTGVLLESFLPRSSVLALFAIGCVACMVASALGNPPDVIVVGASGGLNAMLFGGFLSTYCLAKGTRRERLQFWLVPLMLPAVVLFLPIPMERVDRSGHLGGALAGLFAGAALQYIGRRFGAACVVCVSRIAVVLAGILLVVSVSALAIAKT